MVELATLAGTALNIAIRTEAQKYFKKRAERTTRLIVEALRTAKVEPKGVEKEESIAGMCVATYMAMAQGAAFRNLAVIAKVLAHKAADPNDNPDDFMSWVDAIAGLRHEEAVLLATLHAMTEEARKTREAPDKQHGIAIGETKRRLVGPTKLIKSDDEFQALCGALSRTGFVILVSLASGLSAAPAPRLAQLAKMANLQAWADEQNECE
jgi:hypothetical protein